MFKLLQFEHKRTKRRLIELFDNIMIGVWVSVATKDIAPGIIVGVEASNLSMSLLRNEIRKVKCSVV
ncbi:hypothetical protein DWZ37_05090 [Clostridiaceae bacterium AF31-3BH]|nr:hypothetical protein DWZ37_05090 [Clostridiaceae bacterium AF31-3BH]